MRLVTYQRSLLLASLLAAFLLAANAASALAQDATTTDLQAVPISSVWGQDVVLTATVKDTPTPTTVPTGTVQFRAGAQDLGSVPVDDAGKAVLHTSAIDVGSPTTVSADFTGPDFGGSHGTADVTVAKALVSVSERVVPDPTVAGQDATIIARVTALAPSTATPTGMVQFSDDDGTPILGPQPLNAGEASVTVPAPAGSYLVHADYDGGTHFIPNSAIVDQTVNKADTATSLSSSAGDHVAPGQTFVLTALVSVTPPGDVPKFGSMRLTIDGVPVGSPVALNGADGVRATLTAPSVPTANTFGFAYSGDDNTNPSSASMRITVGTPVPPPPAAGAPKQPTAAQQLNAMTSALVKALKARGFAALRGTAEPFTAAGPGVLDQKVYSPKAPAGASKARKPVVVATARHVFNSAGAGVLKLRLTAAGKRAIRHAKKLRIAIVTRFTPRNGTAVSVVRRLTVKPRRSRKAAALGGGWSVRAIAPLPRS